ncbi:putative signaling protein [Thalassocella blandensis]|nr:putative signaling protein [Thalassocella blandensis]
MDLGLRNSIGVKLLRIVFGCYLIITIVVTAVQLYFEYGNVEKGVVVELYNVGRSFEDGLSTSLWSLDSEAMNSILVGVGKIEAVAGVKVTNLEGSIEAANGIYIESPQARNINRVLTTQGISANEIRIEHDGVPGIFYEYKFDLFVNGISENELEKIGSAYLYAAQNTVISRFKNSLFLILVNAIIKTVALWLIFLYFSRRILSHPLSDLSQATTSLSNGDMSSERELQRLEVISKSDGKNEVQQLASCFLIMRRTILEKIDNLNALNQFALVLTQANSRQRVYEDVAHLLTYMFGIRASAVFNKENTLVWRSRGFVENTQFNEETLIELHDYNMDIIRGRSEVAYWKNNKGLLPDHHPQKDSDTFPPILYLPVKIGDKEKCEMWMFGKLSDSRLTHEELLSDESMSFLQVITNMVGATLTNINQREIIEDQNHSLEERVSSRTRELAKLNQELMHMAVHDPLTQLPNRTLFNNRLAHQIDIASRDNRQFAVASIDLTEFKLINDTYGHDAGDTVLVEVGRRMCDVLRKSDTLARMGGDEYAAILTGDNIVESIEVVVTNLVDAMQDPILLEDNTSLLANLNIGVAIFPDHGTDADLLFKYADIAMYDAKRSGAGFALFDKDKNSAAKEYLQFMYELEHAIERNQLRLYYQPIMDLKTRRPISFEALLRWEHPDRGMVPPDTFIPHAERTSIIKPITMWVVETACQQCVAWHKRGLNVAISVNLSPRIFTSPSLPSQLAKILTKYDLDPKWLKLEITESTAMARPEQALEIISALSNMGFPISIDDFGTGHSSLSYLTRLPVDELKIDRSFLLENVNSSRVVVQTVIELAHTLDLHVVAEGIEDNETLEMLVSRGCDAVQGYYICRPNTVEHIETWLDSLENQSASA